MVLGLMVHESRSDLFLVGFFVGFWGGGFESFYSFFADLFGSEDIFCYICNGKGFSFL